LKLPAEVLNAIEIISLITGVGYAVLAARPLACAGSRAPGFGAPRWHGVRGLPMQSDCRFFFVGMAMAGPAGRASAATGELCACGPFRARLS
jgi:hypothetical protein